MSESLAKLRVQEVMELLGSILFPRGMGVLDAFRRFAQASDQFSRETFETWAAELADDPDVTDEQIADDTKLFAAFTVAHTIRRAQTRERIRLFARLHANFLKGTGGVTSSDDFKEFVRLLDDLSEREFTMLLILDDLGKNSSANYSFHARRPGQQHLRSEGLRTVEFQDFWGRFSAEVVRRFGLPEDEVQNIVQAISRTGLCQILPDLSNSVKGAGTTLRFERFVAALRKYDKDGTPRDENPIRIAPYA
jgi:hypothetical protein